MTSHPTYPRQEYDTTALDWHPNLIELEEMRRERASLARMAAVLMLALVLLAGWGFAKRVDQVFSSSAASPGGSVAVEEPVLDELPRGR